MSDSKSSPGQMQDGPGPAARLLVVIQRLMEEGHAEVLVDAPVSFPEIQLPFFLATLGINAIIKCNIRI